VKKTPRRRKPIDTHSRTVASPNGKASATAFAIGTLGQVMIEMKNGGGGVFAADCRTEDIELCWRDDDTLEIGYPAGIRVDSRDDELFLSGRTIDVVYRVMRAKKRAGETKPRSRRG
jgi:hypothetical protein